MWTLGDIIVWGTLAIGIIPVAKLFWKSYGQRLVSTFSRPAQPEIMSYQQIEPVSVPVRPRTDGATDGRTEPQAPTIKPATLDNVAPLRAHGFTRDEARAYLKTVDRTLGNDTWAAAAPPPVEVEEAVTVTPIVGRPTRAVFREEGKLKYEEPPQWES